MGGGGAAGNSRVGQSVARSVGPSVAFDFINLNFEKFAEREAAGEKERRCRKNARGRHVLMDFPEREAA